MSEAEGMSHRERAAELTRTTILDAFLALAHSSNAVTVSIPAVAKEAGVSVRTVYRYFPSKDELQNAAAYRYPAIAFGSQGALEDISIDTFGDSIELLWKTFSQRLPAIYAEHSTPAGRELRTTRLPDARARVDRVTEARLGSDAVDLIVAVTSSSMFLELVDRMGYTPAEAAQLAHRLTWLVLEDEIPELKER